MSRATIITTSALLVGLSANCVSGFAQGRNAQGRDETTGKLKLPRSNDPDYKPVVSAVKATTRANTSSLTVVAETGALIFLESSSGQKLRNKCQVEAGSRSCIFNSLKPGLYQVSVELDGYEDAEGKGGEKAIRLATNKGEKVEFNLRPITYTAKLKTNVKTGQVLYKLRGGQQFMEYLQQGSALLQNLPAGAYEIEITTAEVGYQPLKKTLTIGPEQTEFSLDLERRLSEAPLSANWTSLEGWEMPNDWKPTANKLLAKGPGVALPRSEHFRHYADFELVAEVKMNNAIAASFVLRAQDKRNYYLIQVTGGQADRRYVLRGFVVKDGVAKPLPTVPININAYDSMLGNGQFFELTIQCVKSKFTVYLGDSQSGYPLGALEDPDRHFPSGAPGIAVREQEQQEIARFVVTPIKNP